MDLEFRNALIERVENDQRAVLRFLKKAKEFRKEFQESATQSDVPWPYCLLEWDPLSAAPQVVRDVIDTTRANTAFLRNAVFRGGWPGRSLVGCAGADAAWMILQHASSAVSTIGAPGDHEFRASCIPLLERAVRSGEADPRHLAATVDGVRFIDGEPMKFGTFFSVSDGEVHFDYPCAEIACVNDARRTIGLPSVQEDAALKEMGGSLVPYGPGRSEPGMEWPARR